MNGALTSGVAVQRAISIYRKWKSCLVRGGHRWGMGRYEFESPHSYREWEERLQVGDVRVDDPGFDGKLDALKQLAEDRATTLNAVHQELPKLTT